MHIFCRGDDSKAAGAMTKEYLERQSPSKYSFRQALIHSLLKILFRRGFAYSQKLQACLQTVIATNYKQYITTCRMYMDHFHRETQPLRFYKARICTIQRSLYKNIYI